MERNSLKTRAKYAQKYLILTDRLSCGFGLLFWNWLNWVKKVLKLNRVEGGGGWGGGWGPVIAPSPFLDYFFYQNEVYEQKMSIKRVRNLSQNAGRGYFRDSNF